MTEPAFLQGFSAHAQDDPARTALIDGGRRRTYGELDARTDRLAEAFARLGVGEGDRVALILPNQIELVEAWLAIGKLKASMVPCNWHLKADELEWIITDSAAKVVVAHRDLESHWGPAVSAASTAVVVVGDDGPDGFEALIEAVDDAPARSAATLATPVFYTSGTTGRPKGVVHGSFSPEVAIMQQQGQVALWGWTPDDVYITSGPLYHAGPGGYLMCALFVGATTTILTNFSAVDWLALVARDRATISFVVPAHFIRLLEVPDEEWNRYDLSSLRILVHAGAPCPVPVKRRIIERLAPAAIWELYGMSEGGATRIGPDEWLERPGSVGVPWPGIEVRVLDVDGTPQPAGTAGLIYVRPPGGSRFTYHDDAAKTDEAWQDDAFTVGDIGYLDDDGYLFLTDRASDMIIRGGVNVYPREIEAVLYEHEAVVDCAVFGVPDDRLGERIKAVIEVRSDVSADELTTYLGDRLADFKVPADIEFVDELPRLPNGKVLKRQLREAAWSGRESRIG